MKRIVGVDSPGGEYIQKRGNKGGTLLPKQTKGKYSPNGPSILRRKFRPTMEGRKGNISGHKPG